MWDLLEIVLELLFCGFDITPVWRFFLCTMSSILLAFLIDAFHPERGLPLCTAVVVCGLVGGCIWESKSRK